MEIVVGVLAGAVIVLVSEIRRLNGVIANLVKSMPERDDNLRIVKEATKFSVSVVEKVSAAIKETLVASMGGNKAEIIPQQTAPEYEPEERVPPVYPSIEYDTFFNADGVPDLEGFIKPPTGLQYQDGA